jgi:hypothetical protein
VDLARPQSLSAGRAVVCYVELPRGRVIARSSNRALEIRSDPGAMTHARVHVNNGFAGPGAAPNRWWRRRPAPAHVEVGPSIGAPDLLSEAVGVWSAARWLEPGEAVRWDVHIRQIAVEE